MYEVSDYDMCLRLTETAGFACLDTESLRYATLCMTAGRAYYELNQLSKCRKKWEPKGHLEVRTHKLQNHLSHRLTNSLLTDSA